MQKLRGLRAADGDPAGRAGNFSPAPAAIRPVRSGNRRSARTQGRGEAAPGCPDRQRGPPACRHRHPRLLRRARHRAPPDRDGRRRSGPRLVSPRAITIRNGFPSGRSSVFCLWCFDGRGMFAWWRFSRSSGARRPRSHRSGIPRPCWTDLVLTDQDHSVDPETLGVSPGLI